MSINEEGTSLFLTLHIIGIERKTGKTKLIQDLVRELAKRKFRVSTVKHISQGTFDTPHKDTWKHLSAGADEIIAVSPIELVSVKKRVNSSLDDALKEIPMATDVVLVEGFKNSQNPKIIVASNLKAVKELVRKSRQIIAISGLIASKTDRPRFFEKIPILPLDKLIHQVERIILDNSVKELPKINCKRCGYESCKAMAEAILNRQASITECKSLSDKDLILNVNNTRIFLSEFPKKFIRNTLVEMVKRFKGVGEKINKISLEISVN